MKRHHLASLALILAALPVSAEEKRHAAVGASSSSSSSRSSTDGSGNTVTITTTERDGKRETRRTVTAPGGKVVSETTEEGDAAPMQAAKPAAEKGKPGGPWLGVHTAELPIAMREQLDLPVGTGLLVEHLPPDSPAANAGITQHDVLLTLNLTPVSTPEQLRAELSSRRPGDKVLIEYLRKGRREKAAVTLGKRGDPEAVDAAAPIAAQAAGPQPVPPGLNAMPDFPKGTANASAKASTRTVIVGSDGNTKVIETDGDPFASMLRDPNVPVAMKESLRKMQEQMRDFQKRTEVVAPNNTKSGKGNSQ